MAVPIPGDEGQPDLFMVQVEDITAEHEAQEALTYQAFHDPLTGLHNRAWILDILASTCEPPSVWAIRWGPCSLTWTTSRW